jgi:Na+/proline symporter
MVWMALVACSALSPASFMSRSMSSCITMNIEKQYYRSRGKAEPKVIPKC